MKYLQEKMGDLDSKRFIGGKFDDVEVRLQIEQGQCIRRCDSRCAFSSVQQRTPDPFFRLALSFQHHPRKEGE